ncbi:MAG: type VI secretion system protein TssA [Gammaproteobacteria bacterium]|nr:type VI secretion system protein TssA [Gammaproteobacteria bacterium]MDH5652766.1 type VI secretion system protein TssA [Gammaproteobacteria bacterium]
MPLPDSIADIETLLQPIAEDNPVGKDIREDNSPTSIYGKIKDARNAARAAERHSVFDTGGNSEADSSWRKVLDLAPEILESNCKDLEVAAWYTEALVRKYEFSGLRYGFTLMRELVERFWEAGIYPSPDEDGNRIRVLAVHGLNEGSVLVTPIRNIRFTDDAEPHAFTFWHYNQALDVQKAPDDQTRQAKISKLGFSPETIETAVNNSENDLYINMHEDLLVCLSEYKRLGQMLDEYCGRDDAPSIGNIIETLQECLGVINHLAKNKLPQPEEPSEDDDAVAADGTPAPKKAGGPIKTREDAFRNLLEISNFFRKNEPHSPISYALERIVRWGDMPLHDLMRELIPDDTSRNFYGNLTGVRGNE